MADLNEPHIAEAAAAAISTRERLGLAPDGPLGRDLLELTEQDLDIPVSILKLPEGVAGAYQRKRGQSFVFIQAGHYPTRQRFTLAHELGHHVLDHRARVENASDVGGSRTTDPNEQQANYFASEFLIPLTTAKNLVAENLEAGRDYTLDELIRIADDFHVSPPALLYRLTTAGLVREHASRLWKKVNKQEHVELAEQMEIGHGSDEISRIYDAGEWPRLPAKLTDNAKRARAAGFIDEQRFGEVMRTG